MKKRLFIFLRVILVLLLITAASLFGLQQYYLYGSQKGIQESITSAPLVTIGSPTAPFPLVEFIDYRCSHCKEMHSIVEQAIDNDSSIRIILRPTVITDIQSLHIAGMVLSINNQKAGASVMLHKAIMGQQSIPTEDDVKSIITSMGLDAEKAEKDAQSKETENLIKTNISLLQQIGFPGVPALVIGDKGYFPQQKMPTINEIKLMILDAKSRVLPKQD